MATETLPQNNDETIISLAQLLQSTVDKFNELDSSKNCGELESIQLNRLQQRMDALESTIQMLPASGLKAAAIQARIIFAREDEPEKMSICAAVVEVLERESGLDRNECAGVYYSGYKEVAA